jgi:hypothetical protein
MLSSDSGFRSKKVDVELILLFIFLEYEELLIMEGACRSRKFGGDLFIKLTFVGYES